ncbi:MAG: hypothetical protein HY788_03470 [Deltaproteobacteria bacterium]|nr:hypothetical protein [Deltaproteobacteria bacterium]
MRTILLISILVFMFGTAGCQTTPPVPTPEKVPEATPTSWADEWGIEFVSLRLTASDQMLDFRYRIVDPDKASKITKRPVKAHAVHERTGAIHSIPVTKLGPLRGSAVKPIINRVYVILFSNAGGLVRRGDTMTVVIGDFRAEHLKVE